MAFTLTLSVAGGLAGPSIVGAITTGNVSAPRSFGIAKFSIIRPRRSRSASAYSRHTLPWTICRFVRTHVRRSVKCTVEKRRIGSGCRLAS